MRPILAALLVIGAVAGSVLADDHGNSALAATPIGVDGMLLDACIEEPEDMDYFLFAGVAGRSYRILTTHQSTQMDSVLYLLASDGQAILSVAYSSEDQAGTRIRWTCPSDGTFFVMVRHAQSADGTGCYALSISLELIDDHGDDSLSATPLAVNGDAVPGFLETADDVDAFLFSVERGYDYVAEVTRTSNGGGALTVEVSGSTDSAGPISIDGAEEIILVGRDAGSVFLLVRSTGGEASIGYEIRVGRTGYADDFGSDAASALLLDLYGPPLTGSVEVAGDADWFSFDARTGGHYTFTLTTSAGLSCRLILRAADGVVVLEETSTTNGGPAALDWDAPETAHYYLEVLPVSGTGTYALAVASTLQLETVGRFNPSGYSLDVWADGDLVYLIVGVKGLSIVDVSDPAHPHEIGSNSTRGYAEGIALIGALALVANRGEGLTVVDVSDPTRPTEVGSLETPGWAQDVAAAEGFAVVADQRAGIHVVSVASSGAATLLSSYETGGHAGAVTIAGDIAYVAVGDAGLEIVDLSDPLTPRLLGTVALSGDARDVAVRGSIAYVASGYRGVRIVDVADPALAAEVGWFGSSDEAVGLHLAGNHLYVAERAGVSVYSLSDPLEPERVAAIDTPGEAIAVFVTDGLVLIADRQEGLQIARLLP